MYPTGFCTCKKFSVNFNTYRSGAGHLLPLLVSYMPPPPTPHNCPPSSTCIHLHPHASTCIPTHPHASTRIYSNDGDLYLLPGCNLENIYIIMISYALVNNSAIIVVLEYIVYLAAGVLRVHTRPHASTRIHIDEGDIYLPAVTWIIYYNVYICMIKIACLPEGSGPIPEVLQYRANPWRSWSKLLHLLPVPKISLISKTLNEGRIRY